MMVEPDSSKGGANKYMSEKSLESKGTNVFVLHLFIASMDFKSVQAIRNIRDICEENMPGRYNLDIIDIHEHPTLARDNQIIAAPTLIKESPLPLKRLVGNFSDTERVLSGLGLCF